MVITSAALAASCGKPSGDRNNSPSPRPVQTAPAHPRIDVEAHPNGQAVHLVVITNLPLPVEVATSLALMNQRDDDVFIGTDNKHVVLDKPTSEFDVATIDFHGKPLAAGEYEAEVGFYPLWGAKNELAKTVPKTEGVSKPFKLANASLTATQAERRNVQRRWVMENVIDGTPWDEGQFVRMLGPYDKYPATLSRLHDAYYFKGADMTLIVNRLRGEVTVWRDGRASE
jgi:hypothetical protein